METEDFVITIRTFCLTVLRMSYLTQSLRDLEDAMLVERHNLETGPPHVEYSLTERGKTLIPILKQIHAWGDDQMALVVEKAKADGKWHERTGSEDNPIKLR